MGTCLFSQKLLSHFICGKVNRKLYLLSKQSIISISMGTSILDRRQLDGLTKQNSNARNSIPLFSVRAKVALNKQKSDEKSGCCDV